MSNQVIQASDTDYTFTMKIKSEPATEEEESPATTSQTIEHNCNEQHPQNHSPDNPITSLVKTEPPEHDPLEATYTNVRVRCLLDHKQLQSFRIIIS